MIAFDLGSNTLRIVQYDPNTCQRIKSYEKIVRTAKDLHQTHRIGEEALGNIVNALREASMIFDFKAHKTFCVTTQAMRVASNANDVLAHLRTHFELDFEIISGEKEAYLTSLAIEHALNREGFNAHTYALFDLGGGSTEIILCHEGTKKTHSFPFGIVSTAERFAYDIVRGVEETLLSVDPFVALHPAIPNTYKQLVATAGTPTTVAAFLKGLDYAHYNAEKINGTCLHIHDFTDAYGQLSAMDYQEAERYTGTNRRDLVIVGILLCVGIMKKLGFAQCIVMDDGLREGVALSNCNKAVSF